MPELPEVEVVRRGLEMHVVGRTIGSAEVLHPRAVRRHAAGPDDFSAAARGLTITGACRRGKYLWLPVADGTPGAPSVAEDALLAHLGMSGQLLLGDPGQPVSPARPGPFHLHRLRARPEVHRPADVRPSRARAGRRGPAADDRAHRARPDGARFRRGRRHPPPALPPHRHQDRAARSVPGERHRQHLRRRGPLAGAAALGHARRRAQPGRRGGGCWPPCARSWARRCWPAAPRSTACT